MNPYGDPQSARARASVPGSGAASTPDDGSRPAPDAYRRPTGGRAQVSGSATPRGAASVGGTSGRVPAGSAAPPGRASVGSASVGSASVGSASVGSARVGGRASVGAAPVGSASVGSASVARAAVRPSPFGQPEGSPLGGPSKGSKDLAKAAKKRRRANILTAAAAVLVIMLGGGVVAGTYYFDDVQLTEPKPEDQVTQLFAADGKALLATIGSENRSIVPYQSINPVIKQAVMAAEDKGFEDHNGIDMKGILRAAWNNFTGGDTQGASTITQQYARHAADLKEISYNRKLREAVLARKMEDKFEKDEILGRYLNSVYFGRGAYGIEAAVKAYFGNGRSSLVQPGQKGAITAAEAAVIASVIKQPEKSATHPGYDPQNNPKDAEIRWNYTLNNMVEKGWLPAADKPTEFPKVAEFDPDKCRTGCGADKPTGQITKYIRQELRAMGIDDKEQAAGGLRITTTIDARVQKAAEEAANGANKSSPMSKLKDSYKAALVAISPENGRVLAYYGNSKGEGWDYAALNYRNDGTFLGGGRPPGSTFKIYTLAAALSEGYGMDSTWDGKKKKADGKEINNAGRKSFNCDVRRCPLDKATIDSYNFPFYWLADEMGPNKVIEAAHKAGVQHIGVPGETGFNDLTKTDVDKLKGYGNEVGFGQYPITVLDHANGVATLAGNGIYNKAHFVRKVEKRNAETGKFEAFHSEKLNGKQVFDPNVVANIDEVLEKIPSNNGKGLNNGRDAIGKTGTWEFRDGKSGENGDAWMVGATRQIAAAVWIGNYDKDNAPLAIKKPGGGNMSGGSTPGEVWQKFMNAANKAVGYDQKSFDPPTSRVGDKKGNGLEPLPPPPDPQEDCLLGGLFCPPGQGNNQPNQPGQGNNQPNQPGQGDNNGGGQGDNNGGGPGEPTQPGTLPGFPPNPNENQNNGQGGGDD